MKRVGVLHGGHPHALDEKVTYTSGIKCPDVVNSGTSSQLLKIVRVDR